MTGSKESKYICNTDYVCLRTVYVDVLIEHVHF